MHGHKESQFITMEDFIWPYVDPPVYEPYWFERFNIARCHLWMEKNWTLSLYICVAYLTFIFAGKKFMKDRAAFDLRKPLAAWNFGVAAFSIVGLIRCSPELWSVLNGPSGFHRSVCVRDYHNEAAAFWAWLFTLSKVMELGDTVFLVLRKKQVILFHYIALITCWCFYSDYMPIFRWLGICNYFVHSILYSYLFLKSVNINLPRAVSKFIMSIELLQMIVGVILNSYAIWVKVNGNDCVHTTEGIIYQMLLYSTFVILFIYTFKFKASPLKKAAASINGINATRKKVT